MSNRADTFVQALDLLERKGDAGPIAALFAPDASISNPIVKHEGEGPGGAKAFWTAYRAAFETIRSEFRNVVEDERVAILEWVSEGSAKDGPVRYGGVSVIEFGPGDAGGGEAIIAFRAYFDPAGILPAASS